MVSESRTLLDGLKRELTDHLSPQHIHQYSVAWDKNAGRLHHPRMVMMIMMVVMRMVVVVVVVLMMMMGVVMVEGDDDDDGGGGGDNDDDDNDCDCLLRICNCMYT
jgi:hypothetical protein